MKAPRWWWPEILLCAPAALLAIVVLVLIVVALVGCSFNGRWRGDFDRADLIGMCKQLKACDIADTYGAEAASWDRCSLRCGCLFNAVPGLEKRDGLYYTAPMCQPPGQPLLR